MIPYFGIVVGIAYFALSVVSVYVQLRRRSLAARFYAASGAIAGLLIVNALGGRQWLAVAFWTLCAGMDLLILRASRRHAAREPRP